MGLSLGVDYRSDSWKLCLMEHGQTLEFQTLSDSKALLAAIEHVCARYPEPYITLALGTGAPLAPLGSFQEAELASLACEPWETTPSEDLLNFLIALKARNLHCYSLPGIRQLGSVPAHRKLLRRDLGAPGLVCRMVTLLQRMRAREAAWSEMRFLYLEAGVRSWNLAVIEEGRIVNGIGELTGMVEVPASQDESGAATEEPLVQQALWEGLKLHLAGLLALHHFEDIVIAGSRQSELSTNLGDLYQLYLFPHDPQEPEGFETALGAALIADGLYRPGVAAEVVRHLGILEDATPNLPLGQVREPA